MNGSIKAQIIEAEERLRLAMLCSDVAVLDELLAPELVFTSHLGQIMGKADDLAAHRSGALNIREMTPFEQRIQVVGDVALAKPCCKEIATVRVSSTANYMGRELDGDFRFTRVWAKSSQNSWHIVTAHCSAVT